MAHYDIKSSNIMLTSKVKPRIIDFGMASSAKGFCGIGTRIYSAPEVFIEHNQPNFKQIDY